MTRPGSRSNGPAVPVPTSAQAAPKRISPAYAAKLTRTPAEMVRGDLDGLRGVGFADTDILHLAEVVLSAAPFDRGALQVSIGAHERLDAESVNFWLSSWLREQGRSLGERLELAEKKRSEEGA